MKNDDRCFRYASTVALNHKNIVKDRQGISKRGKACMKQFSKDLKNHATKIISYEKKKEITPLKNKENK